MEHRLEFELEREPDYPPEWWYILRDAQYCGCGNELTAQDIETDQEVCEDCR